LAWLQDQIRCAGLFALGAVVPLLALFALLLLGAAALGSVLAWGGAAGVLIGVFLLGNGGYGLWQAFRSFPAPAGRPVAAGDAPELVARLEACSASWKGPGTSAVLLDPDAWGVDLIGTPVLGLLGWTRFHWNVGIYPLLSLSVREFEAAAGWEVVWWSDQQGWLNLQVKRLVAIWQRLERVLGRSRGDRRVWWSALLRPYSRWLLARMQPFLVRECLWTDAIIARQHGPATFVRVLCRLAILRTMAERRIFPDWAARLTSGEPLPADLYRDMAAALARWPGATAGMLELALDGLAEGAPPLLRVRLQQLQAEPAVPLAPRTPALTDLLEGTAVLRELEAGFRAGIEAQRRAQLAELAAEDRRFQALQAELAGSFPDHPRVTEYLRLAFERSPGPEFAEQLAALGRARPEDPAVGLLVLRWALRQGAPEVPELLAALLARDPFLAPTCHRLLGEDRRRRGDLAGGERELDLARRAESQVAQALTERASASLKDPLEPHGCPEGQLRAMITYLGSLPSVGEAFLVRKTVRLHPERPVLLLVVRRRNGWLDFLGRRRRAEQARIARDCPFPPDATGFVLVTGPGPLWGYRARLRRLGALPRAHATG
jgi:hypothetical protein